MKSSVLVAVVSAIFLTLLAVPASAQATRTWVSGVGDDANPCSRTAPCKTWAGAISKTAPGGEIDNLDSGGFGALTITKSITIDGGGGSVASTLVAGTNGFNINAASTDVVIIKNMRFAGLVNGNSTASAGLTGIQLTTAGTVIIENCDINGFANNGIAVVPTTPMKVSISKVHIQNSAFSTGNAGILVKPNGANASVTIANSYIENTLNGIFADGSGGTGIVNVNVTNSVITSSANNGVTISGQANTYTATVVNSMINYSIGTGAVVAGSASSLTLGGDTITNNVTGASQAGGTLNSYKNNQIINNSTNTSGTITQVSFQ
jgi:hypothetical protein